MMLLNRLFPYFHFSEVSPIGPNSQIEKNDERTFILVCSIRIYLKHKLMRENTGGKIVL